MQSWKNWIATPVAAFVGLVLACGIASAQEPEPESDAHEALERVVDKRADGNEAAEKAQGRVDSLSDETDELLAKYRTALKQIQSVNTYNEQMELLIGSQLEELASLTDQLDRVELVGRSVTPLMLRMVDAIEKFVDLDVPFLIDERRERVEKLRALGSRADVTTPEKFRQIMEAYQIENEYGRTIEAYRATLNIDGRETHVNFLRFGRIALVYQSLDESESGVWNKQTRSWDKLDSSHRSSIRAGLRIARKQTAPDLVTLPLPVPTNTAEES
jgi:vacuolar-type H+-ATPase subunit I/STV1